VRRGPTVDDGRAVVARVRDAYAGTHAQYDRIRRGRGELMKIRLIRVYEPLNGTRSLTVDMICNRIAISASRKRRRPVRPMRVS
jgi:hypothetical protein